MRTKEFTQVMTESAKSTSTRRDRRTRATGLAEQAIFTPAWYPRSTPYHPSLPPRRLRMVEEYTDLSATMLTWPAMGGGGISLPYLAGEIEGTVPPRFRYYGFVSDAEYVRACQAANIKAFGVVFSVQGWEIPAVLDDDESVVLQLNELHPDTEEHVWLGLREFTQSRYPKIWSSFESYFPEGMKNSLGEEVTDLWDEAVCRDIHGRAIHAHWIEVPQLKHECHYMDSNNPVWREYIKAIVRMQIDAGVDGVQFDEPDTPMSALQYGGCFCRDCVSGFRDYVIALPADQVPKELRGTSLADFDIRSWLLERGEQGIYASSRSGVTEAYVEFMRLSISRNFAELAQYAHDYAKSVGRSVLVSANTYNMLPVFAALASNLDVLVPEHGRTGWKQPVWNRYASGFGRGKPVCVQMNPYNSPVVPELVAQLAQGRMTARLTTLIYEAAALGISLSIPYGSWMGSHSHEAFYAPVHPVAQAQSFLRDNEQLFSGVSADSLGVLYSIASNYQRSTWAEWIDRPEVPLKPDEFVEPALRLAADLSDAGTPFQIVALPDETVAPDDITSADFAGFTILIAVGMERASQQHLELLLEAVEGGTTLIVDADFARESDGLLRQSILSNPGTRLVSDGILDTLPAQLVVRSSGVSIVDVATDVHDLGEAGLAVHVVHYAYEAATDSVPTASIDLTMTTDTNWQEVWLHRPQEEPIELQFTRSEHSIFISEIPITQYAILHLRPTRTQSKEN